MGRVPPALLGGLFIGVFGSLPIIKAANCCCLWVVIGGLLTTYLLQQRQTEPLETGPAVLGGLVAGVTGWAIVSGIAAVQFAIAGQLVQQEIDQALGQLESNPDIPPGARDMLRSLMTGRGLLLLVFGVTLPLYAVMAMLGALLGLAFFRKTLPPQAQG